MIRKMKFIPNLNNNFESLLNQINQFHTIPILLILLMNNSFQIIVFQFWI